MVQTIPWLGAEEFFFFHMAIHLMWFIMAKMFTEYLPYLSRNLTWSFVKPFYTFKTLAFDISQKLLGSPLTILVWILLRRVTKVYLYEMSRTFWVVRFSWSMNIREINIWALSSGGWRRPVKAWALSFANLRGLALSKQCALILTIKKNNCSVEFCSKHWLWNLTICF